MDTPNPILPQGQQSQEPTQVPAPVPPTAPSNPKGKKWAIVAFLVAVGAVAYFLAGTEFFKGNFFNEAQKQQFVAALQKTSTAEKADISLNSTTKATDAANHRRTLTVGVSGKLDIAGSGEGQQYTYTFNGEGWQGMTTPIAPVPTFSECALSDVVFTKKPTIDLQVEPAAGVQDDTTIANEKTIGAKGKITCGLPQNKIWLVMQIGKQIDNGIGQELTLTPTAGKTNEYTWQTTITYTDKNSQAIRFEMGEKGTTVRKALGYSVTLVPKTGSGEKLQLKKLIPGDGTTFTQANDIPFLWEITNKNAFPGKTFNFEWKITDAANKDVFVVTWHDKNKFPKDPTNKCVANNGNDWICPWAIIPKGTLQPGAYTWSVEAGDGVKGYGWTNLGTFTVVPPEKPAFACANKWITLTGDSAANQVNLAWSNSLPEEYTDTTKEYFTDRTGKKIEKITAAEKTYFVHRSENSAFSGEKVMPLMSTAASNYTDAEGLIAGKTYYYYIEGDKGTKAGYHYCSNVISITVSDKPAPAVPPVAPPATPVKIDLKTTFVDGKAKLAWTDSEKTATGYFILRSETPMNGSTDTTKYMIGSQLPASTKEATDANIAPGKTYYYAILGSNHITQKKYISNEVTVTVPSPTAPVAPVVTLSAIATDSKVDLFWTDTGKVATLSSYKLTRAEVPNAFGTANSKLIAEFKPNAQGVVAMKYTDNGGGQNLQNGKTYYYVLERSPMVNSGVSSIRSLEVSATPVKAAITLSATPGDNKVDLSWTDTYLPGTFSGYFVMRSEMPMNGGVFVSYMLNKDTPNPVAQKTFTDTLAKNGKTYYYAILGAAAPGQVQKTSNEVSVSPNGVLPVENIKAVYNEGPMFNSLELTWSDANTEVNKAKIKSYLVFASLNANVDTSSVSSKDYQGASLQGVGNNSYSFLDTAGKIFAPGKKFSIVVVSNNSDDGKTPLAKSYVFSYTIPPNAGKITMSAPEATSAKVKLTWTDTMPAAELVNYEIYKAQGSVDNIFDAKNLSFVTKDKFYTDMGIESLKNYTYAIKGTYAGFHTVKGNQATVQPPVSTLTLTVEGVKNGKTQLKLTANKVLAETTNYVFYRSKNSNIEAKKSANEGLFGVELISGCFIQSSSPVVNCEDAKGFDIGNTIYYKAVAVDPNQVILDVSNEVSASKPIASFFNLDNWMKPYAATLPLPAPTETQEKNQTSYIEKIAGAGTLVKKADGLAGQLTLTDTYITRDATGQTVKAVVTVKFTVEKGVITKTDSSLSADPGYLQTPIAFVHSLNYPEIFKNNLKLEPFVKANADMVLASMATVKNLGSLSKEPAFLANINAENDGKIFAASANKDYGILSYLGTAETAQQKYTLDSANGTVADITTARSYKEGNTFTWAIKNFTYKTQTLPEFFSCTSSDVVFMKNPGVDLQGISPLAATIEDDPASTDLYSLTMKGKIKCSLPVEKIVFTITNNSIGQNAKEQSVTLIPVPGKTGEYTWVLAVNHDPQQAAQTIHTILSEKGTTYKKDLQYDAKIVPKAVLGEACYPVDQAKVSIEKKGEKFAVTYGGQTYELFDTNQDAHKAAETIKNYKFAKICFVNGTPATGYSIQYYLDDHNKAVVSDPEKDLGMCKAFKPDQLKIGLGAAKNSYFVYATKADGSKDFDIAGAKSQEGATAVVEALKKYSFNQMCMIGTPTGFMQYFLQGKADATPTPTEEVTPVVTLAATAGDSKVDLTWTDTGLPENLQLYTVYRGETPNIYLAAGTVTLGTVTPPAALTYSDTTAKNGTKYYYIVQRLGKTGKKSVISNEVNATPATPNQPAGVVCGDYQYLPAGAAQCAFLNKFENAINDAQKLAFCSDYKTLSADGAVQMNQVTKDYIAKELTTDCVNPTAPKGGTDPGAANPPSSGGGGGGGFGGGVAWPIHQELPAAPVVTTVPPVVPVSPYVDVNPTTPGYASILKLTAQGVLQGYQKGGIRYFKPAQAVNRAEAAKLILESVCVKPLPSRFGGAPIYSDVLDTRIWFSAILKENFARSYFSGYEGKVDAYGRREFRPANVVTRAELTKVLVQVLRKQGIITSSPIPKTSPWWTPYITIARNLDKVWVNTLIPPALNELITADEAKAPNVPLTRALTAMMIDRMMQVGGQCAVQ